MADIAYDDPRWKVTEEHEDADGTWSQQWELVEDDGSTHIRQASGINRRALTAHPPEDVA